MTCVLLGNCGGTGGLGTNQTAAESAASEVWVWRTLGTNQTRPKWATLHLVVMELPMKNKFSAVPVKEEVESEDGNNLLFKRRRTELSGSIVQLKQDFEVFGMENKVPDAVPVENSTGKETIDALTSCAVQNSRQANGCSNESASSRLPKICKANGWKEPAFDFEEQGPSHNRVFTCKVTVHLDGLVNTVVECFSDTKPKKKAAREHAAQGVLWCLQRAGYVKCY